MCLLIAAFSSALSYSYNRVKEYIIEVILFMYIVNSNKILEHSKHYAVASTLLSINIINNFRDDRDNPLNT